MIKRLKGVLGLTGLGLASAQAAPISLPHGSALSLFVGLASDDGTAVDPGGGTLRFRVMSSVGGSVLYTATALGERRQYDTAVEVTLPRSLPIGTYTWDLWYQPSGGEFAPAIPLSSFVITQSSV